MRQCSFSLPPFALGSQARMDAGRHSSPISHFQVSLTDSCMNVLMKHLRGISKKIKGLELSTGVRCARRSLVLDAAGPVDTHERESSYEGAPRFCGPSDRVHEGRLVVGDPSAAPLHPGVRRHPASTTHMVEPSCVAVKCRLTRSVGPGATGSACVVIRHARPRRPRARPIAHISRSTAERAT